MGPADAPKNPNYKQVCSGETGHVEVYDFDFKGDEKTYEDLVRFFFQFHDPTTPDRQGYNAVTLDHFSTNNIFLCDLTNRQWSRHSIRERNLLLW